MLDRLFDSSSDRSFPDTLRLADHQLIQVLNELDSRSQAEQNHVKRDNRRFTRFPYRVNGGVLFQLFESPGVIRNFRVFPADISIKGVSFLHGGFIYPQRRCKLQLITPDEEQVLVEGTTVRCRHIVAHLHIVAVELSQTIDLTHFIDNLPTDATFHEPTPETSEAEPPSKQSA